MKIIKDNFKIDNFDNINNILDKIIGGPIEFEKSENTKLNLNSQLFHQQNLNSENANFN